MSWTFPNSLLWRLEPQPESFPHTHTRDSHAVAKVGIVSCFVAGGSTPDAMWGTNLGESVLDIQWAIWLLHGHLV